MRAEDFLDSTSVNEGLGSAADFLDAKPAKKQNKGIVGDIGTGLKRGVEQMPGMVTGLADIAAAPVSAVTGINRPFSRAADYLGEKTGFQPSKWAEQAAQEYSPEMQQSLKNVEQADGFMGTLGAIAENPRSAINLVAESLPSTLAGGILARGAMGAVTGAENLAALRTAAAGGDAAAKSALMKAGAIAGGVGEGAVTAGQQMAQTDYEADPLKAAGAATAAGIGTGIIGGVSGRVANKIGLADIEGSIASGTLGAGKKAGKAAYAGRIAGGALQEGALEEMPQSAQEQVWQNVANGKPWDEGVGKASAQGLVAGMAMGAGVNALPGSKYVESKAQPPAEEQQPIAGLLPAPNYTGTPGDQLIANDAERQAAIDAADANAAAVYAAREAFESQLRQSVTIINEPAPLQQRIDDMLNVDASKMNPIQRANYEKTLAAAFSEPIGIRHDANQREVPFTMGEYLDAQVAAENAVRARPLKQNAAQQADARLQQVADEEGYVAPEVPVVGTLSAVANMAIQSGAHKQNQMQQAMQAAVASQKTNNEGTANAAQAKPLAQEATRTNDAQAGLASSAAQAASQGTGVAAPAAFSASVPALKASDSAKAPEIQNGDGVTNLPTEKRGIKTIDRWSAEELQGRLDRGNLSPESEQRLRAELAKRQPVKQSAPQASPLTVGKTPNGAEPVTVRNGVVHVGDYPAIDYETEADITVPEGATPQQIADALRNGGALGSRKIFGLKADEKQEAPAVDDPIGWTRMPTVEREALVAKAGWTGKTRGINLGGAIVAKQAWGKMSEASRAKLVAASQNTVKNAAPAAATVSDESTAPKQEPIKKEDDWLGALFGAAPTAEEAANKEAQSTRQAKDKADRVDSAIAMLTGEIEASNAAAAEVAARNYKSNRKQIELKGDGPGKNGSLSISAINESRKRRTVEALQNASSSIKQAIEFIAENPDGAFKQVADMEAAVTKQFNEGFFGPSAKLDGQLDMAVGSLIGSGSYSGEGSAGRKLRMAAHAYAAVDAVSQPKTDAALQNRDRGRAASVNQMQSIARNPDYMRLGPSRTPDSGAPMVFAVGNDTQKISPANFGANDIAVMSDGQRVPFRYAVVDARSVEPSNFADGATNPAFASEAPGTLKALNNGRTAGVRAAHEAGSSANYTAELLDDQAHGVSPAAIRSTPNPMLVRVYAEQANTGDMAAKSQGQGLGMSASERATQDAELMTSDVLDKFAPGDIASAGNRDFVRAFVGKLAENELADMMDATGNLSQDGRRRIEAALLTAAYGKSDLVQELFESTDTDIKAIGNALKVMSGQWAAMRQAAKDGSIDPATDMTANLIEAVNIVRRSRAEGSSIAELAGQGDLMGGNYLNELSELFLRIFYKGKNYDRARGGDKVIAALHDVVTSAMNTKAEAGLFGDSFKATPKQIVESARSKIDEENKPASQAALFGANGQVAAVSQGNRSEGTAQPGQVGSRPVGTDRSQEAGKQAEPVAKAAEQSPAVDAKEPWQMTRKEWYDAKNNDRAETFGSSGKRNGAAETAARIERKARLNYGVAENGEPVDHRQVIEKAIADGKQIPDEVLADYPDLKESGIALLSPSLGRVDANKVDIAVASKVVADLLSGWRNAPDSRVVATFDDLPAAVRKEIEDQGEKTARGVFHGDTFYLIADEHASANEIEETIFHEVWAHYGLRSMLGANTTRELAGVFDQISASGIMGVNGKDAFRAFARRNGFNTAQTESMLRKAEAFDPRFTEAMKKRILVEELIAKVQEKGDNPSLKRKAQEIIGAIREWLRKVGFSGLMKYSDADLMRLVQKARDTVKYGKRGSSGKGDVPSVLMTAWHGSPHDHDKFDSSKIGTGEGAQAYGYGHYFAGAKDVAEWYRRKLSGADNSSITFNGKQYGDSDAANRKLTNDVKKWAEETGRDPERIDVALEYLAGMAGDLGSARQLAAKEGLGISHWIYGTLNDLSEHLYPSPNGRLYQVELAPTADEYLDWDKPLSEQSEFVRNALTDKSHFIGEYLSDTLEIAKNNGVDFNERGDTLYKIVSDQYGSDKAASDYLHSIGIRGIRYLDGSSRSAGEGNSNYVIFNDADVSITAKYNKASKDKLTPADTAIYGMAAEGKSAAEVLKFIASASRSPFNRQVAKLLLKTGIAPSVTVGDGKGWKMNAGEGNKYAAGYNPKTDTISLFRPASSERNMLHELIHAATLKALSKKGMASAQMNALYQHVKKSGKLKGMYGMSDVDEFIAEAFSNPKFQAALKQVAAPSTSTAKSAWHWFVRVIKGILGLPSGSENALSQALEIGIGVMRENMRLNEGAGDVRYNAAPGKINQTDTEAFRKWFGDSRVVDADGKPMRVYHGTGATDIGAFNVSDRGSYGGGIYLTPEIRGANDYAIYRGAPSSTVYPVYAAIKNPASGSEAAQVASWKGEENAREELIKRGYDGVVDMRSGEIVAFYPEQIKSAIGNNGDFDPNNQDIRYNVADEGGDIGRIVGDSGRQYDQRQRQFFKNVGRDVAPKNLMERTKEYLQNDFWKKMAVGIVDQFRGLRDLNDNGQAYMLARLSKGTAGAFETLLHHGKLSLKDGVYDGDQSGGFIEKLGVPLHGELDDFLWWVAANRAEGLAKNERENLFTPEDIAAGKSLASGETTFDYTIQTGPGKGKTTRSRAVMFSDAQRVFNEFQKNTLDMAEQSGLIDGASRKFWESEFYVPFYRVSEEDGEFIGAKMGKSLVRQQAFKKLKGGTDKLNSDLLSNTLLNWSHLIEASAKNRAAKASLVAAEQVGAAHKAEPGEKKTVWFMDNGQKIEYVVTDPFVMTAITSLEYAGMRNGIMDVMTKFKHWLTIGVTASPAFKVRNLIRDSIQAIGTSDLGYNPAGNIGEGYAITDGKTATKNFAKSLVGMAQEKRKFSQAYVSALSSGGLIRFGTMLEGKESDRIRQLIKTGVKDSSILDSESKWRAFYDKHIEPAINAYNELGNVSEEINRASLYDQMIKNGVSHADAALAARDLMDFSMQGSFNTIRFLTQIVPFMNARLQGMYKLGRSAKDNPRKLAIVTGAVALASIALMLGYEDDDDWKRREDWDRDNFWWFKFGGIEYRIPKPFEVGAVGTLAERSMEYMLNDEMTGERFRKVVGSLVSNNLSMNPIPQVFKPMLDLYANKDSFTGRPIESMGMQRLDPTMRYNSGTSLVARGLSSATLGALSPVQYDHLTRAYFGWLGAFVVGGADMATRVVSNEPTQPAMDYWKFATQGIAREEGTGSSRYVTMIYDQAKELEQAHATYRRLLKDGKIDDAKEYSADHADELLRYRQVERVKKIETQFNERIHSIERSDLDSGEKRVRIERINKMKENAAKRLAPGYGMWPPV